MYNADNIFSKILKGDIPSDKVYEDEFVLAIKDVQPAAKAHVLVLPKANYVSFNDFTKTAGSRGVGVFFERVQVVAAKLGLEEQGYRIIMNHGNDANQTVPHFHVHIVGGQNVGPLLATDTELR